MLHSRNPPDPETQNSQKIQINPKFEFEFVPRDTEKSGLLDLVNSIWWGVAISVVTAIECVSVACLVECILLPVECISVARISIAYTGWPKPRDCLIFAGHFPQKSPIISGSSAKHDLQLKASYGSLPPSISIASLFIVCVCVVDVL